VLAVFNTVYIVYKKVVQGADLFSDKPCQPIVGTEEMFNRHGIYGSADTKVDWGSFRLQSASLNLHNRLTALMDRADNNRENAESQQLPGKTSQISRTGRKIRRQDEEW
jgi:hypothetical protein